MDLNFSRDYCKNLSLLSGMDDKGLRWAIEKVLIIQDTDPKDGTVGSNYMGQLKGIDTDASESTDTHTFYLNYMVDVVSKYMKQSPDSCK